MSSKVLNVLFIEDDLTHLGTLVVHLKTAGYRLRYTVLDGIEGLNESLDHTRFHVVIIDLETLDLDQIGRAHV